MGDRENKKKEDIRRQAEAMLYNRADDKRLVPQHTEKLTHEIQVHQIELELQNEELRSTQNRLEVEREKYSFLYNYSPIGYLTLNKYGIILESNQTFADLLGENPANLIHQPFADYIVPEDRRIFLAKYSSFFRNPDGKDLTLRLSPQKGPDFYVRLYGRKENTTNSKLNVDERTVLFVAVANIDDQVQADIELNQTLRDLNRQSQIDSSMAQLAQVLLSGASIEETSSLILETAIELTESVHGFVGYLDRETGKLISPTLTRDIWNECDMPEKNIVFEKFTGLWGWVLSNRRSVLTNNPSQDDRSSGVPTGHIPIGRFLATPVIVENELTGIVALANSESDYTENDLALTKRLASLFGIAVQRMQSEDDLRAAKEAAEAANVAKSNFLATISHEIRTPMNAVLGFTSLAIDEDSQIKQKEYLDLSMSSAKHLVSLIDEILDFARIDNQIIEFNNREFEFQATIKEVVAACRLRADDKGLELELQLDDEIPTHLVGDRDRLKQVLFNLIINAIKFTKIGKVSLKIRMGQLTQEKAVVSFIIEDTGIGIPSEKYEDIFRPFSQVDSSTSREYGGTGLGLAISQKIVNALGSRIHVESQIGQGSRFYFSLEFMLDIESKNKVLFSESSDKIIADTRFDAAGGSQGPTVMLVEDNPINQKLAGIILGKLNCEVFTASNGVEAIERFENNQIDIIFMDIEMPGMNGLEVTRALRSLEKGSGSSTPIIAMTAHAMKGDRERFIEAGMDDYIAKPIDKEALESVLRKYAMKAGWQKRFGLA